MSKDYEVIETEKIFKGKIINVVRDKVNMPNGNIATRELIKHGGAAAIIPVDKDGNIIFVRQYRHSAKKFVLEIPAGTIENGEDPYDCAMRELEEETSYKTEKMKFITQFYSAIGFCTEIIYLYLAENLQQGVFNFDDDEFITIEKYPLEKAIEFIYNGEICDSKTMVAILAYKEMKDRK